jgi:hypothetical protein
MAFGLFDSGVVDPLQSFVASETKGDLRTGGEPKRRPAALLTGNRLLFRHTSSGRVLDPKSASPILERGTDARGECGPGCVTPLDFVLHKSHVDSDSSDDPEGLSGR